MKTSSTQIRFDPKLKEDADRILKKIGLTPTQAIALLYKAIVRDQGLPPDLRIPNKETAAALRRSENDKNLIAFDNIEEMFEYLESEDDEAETGSGKKVSKRRSQNAKKRKTSPQS